MRWNYYKLRQLTLLQSAMDSCYKLRQLFYYKVRHGLLQIATGITKCDEFITNSNRYYKVRWSLQIATVHMSKVFDSLDHNYLLTKLRRLGLMQSAAASWFSSYLLFRKQSRARCLSQKYFYRTQCSANRVYRCDNSKQWVSLPKHFLLIFQ